MKIQGNVAVLITLLLFVHESVGKALDDYIRYYENVDYSSTELNERHMRHRRSVINPVHVDINAFKRHYRLVLRHDSSMFSRDLTLEFQGKEQKPDISFIYSGYVEGIPGSQAHGAIIEGIFRGWFTVPSEKETYHVEKSRRFFDNPVFHSVIYKESDMNLDPYREKRERERREAKADGTCGYENSRQWMQGVVRNEYLAPNRAKRSEMAWQEVNSGEHSNNKYTEQANREESHSREKRQTTNLGKNNTCFMSLTSDPKFWDHFLLKSNNNRDVARDEILAFFSSHIIAINNIYGRTTFSTYDGSISYSGVQFRVQKTKVETENDCPGSSSFCEDNIDVSNFLNLNSQTNHNLFCLAYVFTHRDFSQGTLGLAWVGAVGSAAGGLCETYKAYSEGEKRRVMKSLNTGVITILNYGKDVPVKVSQLTFAHEVGHNFGSPHDAGTECAPYGTSRNDANEGNYIMFASATMGDRPHNSQFSICSKDNITRVLDAVINNRQKVNCFKEGEASFCGNGLVEEGEECDCGFKADCEDSCCNPKDPDATNTDQECKLKAGSLCSPTQGPCCSDSCNFITVTDNKTCRYQEDCFSAAYCDGAGAACPDSQLAPNGTYCNNYGFTCQDGECAGSLCEQFGWVECYLTTDSKTPPQAEREELCKLGCKQNDTTSECILSSDKDALVKYPAYSDMVTAVFNGRSITTSNRENGVQLAPGSPCNNFQGYCDVFFRCRGVDAEGPLSRLKNLIFNPETLDDITNWIVEHWWAVLLMAIGLVLAMGIFIKFCAVHTPSSNPKAKPARKLSETMTLRRRRNQNRQNPSSHSSQPQPQQVRYPQNPQGPPPPYPGSSNPSSHMGPPHGHGKGKGRHKSRDMEMGRI